MGNGKKNNIWLGSHPLSLCLVGISPLVVGWHLLTAGKGDFFEEIKQGYYFFGGFAMLWRMEFGKRIDFGSLFNDFTWKSVKKITGWAVGAIATAILVSFLKKETTKLSEIAESFHDIANYIFSPRWGHFFILMTAVAFVVFLLSRVARVKLRGWGGTKNEQNWIYQDRIALEAALTRFYPLKFHGVLQGIHFFQHEFEKWVKILSKYPDQKKEIIDEDFLAGINDLLIKAKSILNAYLMDDVAVHIKLFVGSKDWTRTTDLKNAVLKTYYRIPPKRKARGRSNDEIFKASATIPQDWSSYFDKLGKTEHLRLENQLNSDEEERINTAYDYVLQPYEHFYICNDLALAQKQGAFYSNSLHYEEFYNSLAVFLIYPHLGDGQHIGEQHKKDKPFPVGLLIIDSLSTGLFDKSLRDVGGYLAHRFYEYFEQVFRSQKQQPTANVDGNEKII